MDLGHSVSIVWVSVGFYVGVVSVFVSMFKSVPVYERDNSQYALKNTIVSLSHCLISVWCVSISRASDLVHHTLIAGLCRWNIGFFDKI